MNLLAAKAVDSLHDSSPSQYLRMEMIEGTLYPGLADTAVEYKVRFGKVEVIAEDFDHQCHITVIPAISNFRSGRLRLDRRNSFTSITPHVIFE